MTSFPGRVVLVVSDHLQLGPVEGVLGVFDQAFVGVGVQDDGHAAATSGDKDRFSAEAGLVDQLRQVALYVSPVRMACVARVMGLPCVTWQWVPNAEQSCSAGCSIFVYWP